MHFFGYHGNVEARWTEEYPGKSYRHQIAMLKRIPFLRGTTPHYDSQRFSQPVRTLPVFQDSTSTAKVWCLTTVRRENFVLQKFYRSCRVARSLVLRRGAARTGEPRPIASRGLLGKT